MRVGNCFCAGMLLRTYVFQKWKCLSGRPFVTQGQMNLKLLSSVASAPRVGALPVLGSPINELEFTLTFQLTQQMSYDQISVGLTHVPQPTS